jgi:hypothetical protein
LYNHSTKEYFQPSANVTKIFQEQKDMQKSLGFNPNISLRETYPRIHTRKVPEVEKEEIPIVLQQGHSHYEIRQIASIKLNQKEIIRKGSFVLVNHLKYNKKNQIMYDEHILTFHSMPTRKQAQEKEEHSQLV